MRKFDMNVKPALESQPAVVTAEPETLEVLEPVVVRDPEESEIDELSEGVDELNETTAALESLALTIEASLSRGGMTSPELNIAKMHADYLTKRIGLESIVVSNESATTRYAQSQLALESIKQAIGDTVKAIVEFIRKLFDKFLSRINEITDWAQRGFDQLILKFSKLPESAYDRKVPVNTRLFYYNGKLSRDLIGDIEASISTIVRLPVKGLVEASAVLDDAEAASKEFDLKKFEHRLSQACDIGYDEANGYLKFTGEDGLATQLISGRRPLAVIYQKDPDVLPHSKIKVVLDEQDAVVKNITLRSLGISSNPADSLKKTKENYLSVLESYETSFKNVENELRTLAKNAENAGNADLSWLVKEGALVIAALTKIRMAAYSSIIDALSGLLRMVEAANSAE